MVLSVQRVCRKYGKGLVGNGCVFSGSVGCCGIAHDCQHMECPEKVCAVRRAVNFGPCFPVEKIKARAVCGLHMMAEEDASLSNSDISPEFGDLWRYGCPKSPVWSSGGDDWAGSESASSVEEYEHNVGSLALEVIGQNWSGVLSSSYHLPSPSPNVRQIPFSRGTFSPVKHSNMEH